VTALHQRDSVVIGRLRIRTSFNDPLAAQRKFSNLLRTASLSPSGLPASSLLCIRRMRDPSPRTQPLESGSVYLLPDWEQAVARSLDCQATEAARPALAPVPSGANAVLFLDDSELLAALAWDWLTGTLPLHWWWRQILKTFDSAAIFQHWMRAPEAIPAAIERLRFLSCDEPFVRSLPDRVASELLRRMLYVHGIPTGGDLAIAPAVASEMPGGSGSTSSIRQDQLSGSIDPAAPWSPWIQELSSFNLSADQEQFLVQSLMLRRARGVARSEAFQHALAAWVSYRPSDAEEPYPVEEERAPDNLSQPASRPADGTNRRFPATPLSLDDSATLPSESRGGPHSGSLRPVSNAHEASQLTAEDGQAPIDNSEADASKVVLSEPIDTRPEATTSAPDELNANPAEVPAASAEDSSSLRSAFEPQHFLRVETAFGGVFFLLNAAIALGYYSDFTAPLDRYIDLDIWDFLAIFGDRFTSGELRNDPLWETLAHLAGRGDSSKSEDPAARIASHFAPSQEWIDSTANHVSGYLDHALKMPDAASFLCRRPSSLTCTPTHVDIFFSMQTHPIEIRKACLDRDPGWIPAAGYYVAFHFD